MPFKYLNRFGDYFFKFCLKNLVLTLPTPHCKQTAEFPQSALLLLFPLSKFEF